MFSGRKALYLSLHWQIASDIGGRDLLTSSLANLEKGGLHISRTMNPTASAGVMGSGVAGQLERLVGRRRPV